MRAVTAQRRLAARSRPLHCHSTAAAVSCLQFVLLVPREDPTLTTATASSAPPRTPRVAAAPPSAEKGVQGRRKHGRSAPAATSSHPQPTADGPPAASTGTAMESAAVPPKKASSNRRPPAAAISPVSTPVRPGSHPQHGVPSPQTSQAHTPQQASQAPASDSARPPNSHGLPARSSQALSGATLPTDPIENPATLAALLSLLSARCPQPVCEPTSAFLHPSSMVPERTMVSEYTRHWCSVNCVW